MKRPAPSDANCAPRHTHKPGLACHKRSQAGLTMVELMVAVAVGLFLILGTIQVYLSSRQAAAGLEANARLMENGRVATEILNRAVRLGRYWGCAGVTENTVTNHLIESPAAAVPGMTVQGIYGEDSIGPYGSADAITLFLMENDSAAGILDIDDPGNSGANPDPLSQAAVISVAEGSGISTGDYIVINDCSQADIFDVTSAAVSTGNPDELALTNCTTCTHSYTSTASVYTVKRLRYSIATGVSGEPALFVQENAGTNQELIEGVEDMQIYYGQDIDNDLTVDRYVRSTVIDATCTTNGNVDCWKGVTNVRISLLLRSPETNVTKTAQTYSFDGTSSTATDGRIRREFITIASLRNYRK